MTLKSLAVLALMMVATPAMAEDWVLVTTSTDNSAALLIDNDSIRTDPDGMQSLRILTVLRERTQSFDALMSDVRVDCKANKIRVGRTSSHDTTGKQLGVDEDRPEWGWDPIKPGSNYETVVKVVCRQLAMPTGSFGAPMPIAQVRRRLTN